MKTHMMTNLEEVFNSGKLGLVQSVSVWQPTVMHQCEQLDTGESLSACLIKTCKGDEREKTYSGINSVDHGEDDDGSSIVLAHGAECGEDSAKDDLEDHQDPAHGAEDLVLDKVLAPLEDHISVESFRHPFGWPVPAYGMDNIVRLALPGGTKAVGDPSPFSRGEEAMLNRYCYRLGSQIRSRRGTSAGDLRGVDWFPTRQGNA